jgi:HK97 family phage major capsid protein
MRVAFAAVRITNELLRSVSPEALTFLRRELAYAMAFKTDEEFFRVITTGVTNVASAGATSLQIMQDLANLLAAVELGSASKPYLVVQSATAKALSSKTTTTGHSAFPEMGPQGGTLCNIPTLVCDALTNGTVVLFDAAQIVTGASEIEPKVIRHGDGADDSEPDSPPVAGSVMRGTWMHNEVIIRLQRDFGVELPSTRTSAVALLTNVNYQTGNSPS